MSSQKIRRHYWWIYILIFIISQLMAGVLPFLGRLYGNSTLTGIGMVSYALLLANLIGITLFFCYRPCSVTWANTLAGFRGRKGRRGGLVFLLAIPTILLVNLAQEVLLPDLPNWVGDDVFANIFMNPAGLITVCLIGPICEELLFRGGVLTDLSLYHSDQGWFVPVLLTAALFAMVHVNPAQLPAAFTLGILLGFAYWWTGSLVAPVCIHVFNNSFACLMNFLSPDDDSMVAFFGGSTSAGLVAVVSVFAFYLIIRAVQKEGIKEV